MISVISLRADLIYSRKLNTYKNDGADESWERITSGAVESHIG